MSSRDPDGPAEDVLDLGNRPRIPRWAFLVGGLLVAVLIAGVVVALGLGSPGSPAPSTPAPSTSPASNAAAGDVGGAADADDVLALGNHLFQLTSDALYRTDATDSPRSVSALPIEGLDALGPADSFHLVGDAAAHVVWAVGYGGAPTTVLAVSTDTMAVKARVTWPQSVDAAAALNGHLYLVTANAVVDVPLNRPPGDVARLTSHYMSVTADTARGRLLLLDSDSRSVVSYDPATRAVRSGAKMPFGKGNVLVDGSGHVWAGGYRFTAGGGAVLTRLDPRTLRPITSSPLAGQLGPGAQLVASGASVIWVRSGAGGDDLWCVDGRTGRPAQHWQRSGAVTSRAGYAVTDVVGALQPLTLRGCRG